MKDIKLYIGIILTLAITIGGGLFGYGKLQAQVENNTENIRCQFERVDNKLDKIYDYMINQ